MYDMKNMGIEKTQNRKNRGLKNTCFFYIMVCLDEAKEKYMNEK